MKTFREYLYNNVSDVDLSNKDDATMLVQWLCGVLIRYHDMTMAYEDKMQDLMTAKEYSEWSTKQAKELFRNEWENAEDSDFKAFVLENMDKILGEDGEA